MKTREAQQAQTLVDQQLALQTYLDALLRPVLEVAAAAEAEPVSVPVDAQPESAPVAAQTTTPLPESSVEQAAGPIVPDWAAQRFQCLLFKVAGLTLAVPLVKLNGVLTWPADITPMPGHAPWFLGLVRYQDRNVKVIDTALLVLPENRRGLARPASQEQLQKIILIDDARWGLACESVSQVIGLEPAAVRWRTSRSTRPWLAGTVIDHMCALLDTEAFAHMLATGEGSVA